MQARNTQKAQTDDYFEARTAIEKRSKDHNFMWLEAVEGKKPETTGYAIHVSGDAAMVPPFAIEIYQRGELQPDYQTSKKILACFAIIPEADRLRVVQAQVALRSISDSEVKPLKAAAPA